MVQRQRRWKVRQSGGFDRQMREIVRGLLAEESERPKLLLHVCCAPCSGPVLECLSAVFRVIVYFDNPNLDSRQEFDRRASEAERLVLATGWAEKVVVAPYDADAFMKAVRGLEGELEGGARCVACFALRLGRSARAARDMECGFFTTTLTVSPRKDAALLNRLGGEAGRNAGVPFLPSDFKKRDGYLRSLEISREHGLYRQDYCGCAFSRRARRSKEG